MEIVMLILFVVVGFYVILSGVVFFALALAKLGSYNTCSWFYLAKFALSWPMALLG